MHREKKSKQNIQFQSIHTEIDPKLSRWRLFLRGGENRIGEGKDRKEYILKVQQYFSKQLLNVTALKPNRFNLR